jgi:hypothetical protein
MGAEAPHIFIRQSESQSILERNLLFAVTCVDPRCRPDIFLNLNPTGILASFHIIFTLTDISSDGVFTFRNINGHAASVLKDIVTLDVFTSITDIMVIHHTGVSKHGYHCVQVCSNIASDCGATHYTDEMIRSELHRRLPDDDSISSMSFGAVSGYVFYLEFSTLSVLLAFF